MQRERSRRAKRRLTCTFRVNGQSYRGITLNLSATGLFIQTDTTVAPGCDVEIELMGAGHGPDVRIAGVVARRRAVPSPLAHVVRPGIGVKIRRAPVEYGLLFQDKLLEAPIGPTRGLVSYADDSAAEPDAPPAAATDPLAAPGSAGEPPERTGQAAARPAVSRAAPAFEAPVRQDPRPDVVLMDDGQLGDVRRILEEIDADGLHFEIQRGASPRAWIRPRRLLVASAPLALSFPWPIRCEEDGFLGVAIADTRSQTLEAQLARLGFRYLVSRPVHPQALRILLRQALYGGRERRLSPRFAFDCRLAWSFGFQRHPGTLVDVSSDGCLIVTQRNQVARGSRVKITLPAGVAGSRALALKGRVVRLARAHTTGAGTAPALAVRFEHLSSRTRRDLEHLLLRCAGGHLQPAAGRSAHPAESHDEAPRMHELAALLTEAEGDDTDAGEAKARTGLLGRELSIRGVRVDGSTGLRAGQRFDLEIFEGSPDHPIVLRAEVCRDDDDEGFLLRFVEPTPEDTARLQAAAKGRSGVRSLGRGGQRVVATRIRR